ncbi:MAG: signal recognition particle-docking protein FtsY [Candidatus Nanoarchaeia archaeon]
MFKFLKDKVKSVISAISKKVEESAPEPTVIEKIEQAMQEPVKEIHPDSVPEPTPELIKEKQVEEVPKKVEKKKEEVKEERVIKKEIPVEISKPITPIIVEEKKVIEEVKVEQIQEQKSSFFSKLKDKFTKKEEEQVKEEIKLIEEESKKIPELIKEEKKGFFQSVSEKITSKKISGSEFEELFWELEVGLLESSVALEVVEKIKSDLKLRLVDVPLKRSEVENIITDSLKKSISELLNVEKIDLIKRIKDKSEKPFVIVLFGVNGAGKTTTIAKLANLMKKNNLSVVLAAADTYRAASQEQIKEWGNRLNVKVIAHDYGADPSAVSFDAISFGKAHKIEVVLIDTAGRLHSNVDLLREMEKIIRVTKPDLKIFIAEALVGNDAVEQAQSFNQSVGIDGLILTKADIDEKGGAIISSSYITKKPILYLGCGQELDDLKEFEKDEIIRQLGL